MSECQHLPAHNRGKACAACLRHWRERAEKAEAELDRLAAVVDAALRDDPTHRYMERDEIEGRTRAILAAHAFAVAYEAWNEGDFGEHDDDVGCAACQQEEPLRLAKVAAYEAWRKARAEADGGGDEGDR